MEPPGFSFWTAVAFTVNYIMGCGFLGIPYAFVASGVVLGPCIVLIFGYLVNVTKDFVLEAMARTQVLNDKTYDQSTRKEHLDTMYLISSDKTYEITDIFGILMGKRARMVSSAQRCLTNILCVAVGAAMHPVYVLFLSGYMYGALWAYGTVFASSFTANVPLPGFNGGHTCNVEKDGSACLQPFLLWLGVFALVAVPLACMELREQVGLQVLMFGARILVVLLMTGTVLAGYSCDGVVFTDQGTDHAPSATFASGPGLAKIIPVATYAFIFHHSVPVLSQPVADKRTLPSIFLAAFLVTGTAYATLGTILAVWFGSSVESQANLNWQYYVGCQSAHADGSPIDPNSRSIGASVVSFIILIFPALDVLSAYPLNAITLGNNLMAACMPNTESEESAPNASSQVYGAFDDVLLESEGSQIRTNKGSAKTNSLICTRLRLFRIGFRLLAAVPPIIAGAISTSFGIDLGDILSFTGLIGVAIAFGIPCLLRAWSYAAEIQLVKRDSIIGGQYEQTGSAPVPGGGHLDSEDGALLTESSTIPIGHMVGWLDLLKSPLLTPGGMKTPYSHWSTQYGTDRFIFLLAIAMAFFVTSQMVSAWNHD